MSHHFFRTHSAALVLTLASAAFSAPGFAADQAAVVFDPKAEPALMAGQFVQVENGENLRNLKRVVIPSFMVEYVTEAKAETLIDGIAMLSGAPSNAVIRLKGGDPAKFQAVTDRLYEQTIAELNKAGIEVVPHDKLIASETFKEIASKDEKAPREEEAKGGKGVFHSAKNLPLYFMDERAFIQKFEIKLFNKPKEDLFLTFGTRFGSGFSTAQIPALEEKLAKEFDATALKVRITFLGGSAQVDHSFWTGSTVSIKGAAAFAPMVTRYAFVGGNGERARLSLKDAVTTGELGDLVNVTSDASKAADIARNTVTVASRLLPLLSGGRVGNGIDLGYGNSAEYEWRIEPGTFEKVIENYHPAVARMLLTSLGAAQKSTD